MLPESLVKAEIKLREAEDDLAAALAHGTTAEKETAREAWRGALLEKRHEVEAAWRARSAQTAGAQSQSL
ncbi:hypothetical protein ACWD26_04775 [Streptomyces sp. NPDC002787]